VSCLGVTDGVTPRARAGVTEWAAQTGITPKAWLLRARARDIIQLSCRAQNVGFICIASVAVVW
jgi:hypothetical protein